MYESKNMVERIMMHRSAPIPSLVKARPEVPAALDAVFQKMVAKHADDRYQTMADVGRALQGVLENAASDEAAQGEVMELSIMSLSKGDLAAFLRAREELPEASLASPMTAPAAGSPGAAVAAGSEPTSGIAAGPFDFTVDSSRKKTAKPAPTKKSTPAEVDDAEQAPTNSSRKGLYIGLAAVVAAAAIGLGIWFALT
jgi:hypothetical protein